MSNYDGYQSPFHAFEQRRRQIENTSESGVKLNFVRLFVPVSGAGELTYNSTFPVTFVDRPSVFSGYEMDENNSPSAGRFAKVSVGVQRWQTYEREVGRYYTGGTFGIVVEGTAIQRVIVHIVLCGDGLRAALTDTQGTSGVV